MRRIAHLQGRIQPACNETVGIWTPFSGIPLIGPAVNSFAFQMAFQRRAEGEAVAAQKKSGHQFIRTTIVRFIGGYPGIYDWRKRAFFPDAQGR